jgi:hypothetical protein
MFVKLTGTRIDQGVVNATTPILLIPRLLKKYVLNRHVTMLNEVFKMKKTLITIILVMLLLLIVVNVNDKNAKETNEISEQDLEISPKFEVGEHTMIGKKSKLGIIETTFVSGKEQGVYWLLWGKTNDLVKGTFRLTAKTEGSQPITLADNQAIAYGTKGADAQVPTVITIPSSGLWKFNVYINEELFESIVVDVH